MNTPETAAISPEQAADLAALESGAAAELPPGAPVNGEVQPFDEAAAWAELPAFFGDLLAMAMPEMKQVYTPAACQKWGEKMAPFARDRGWDVQAVMGNGIQLAIATAPMVMGSVGVVRMYRAKAKAAEQIAKQAQGAGALAEPSAPLPAENPGEVPA